MAWNATVIGTEPTMGDSIYVNVRFSDGGRSFTKSYKMLDARDAEAFVVSELARVEANYAALQELPDLSIDAIPHRVTMAQARAQLMRLGLFDAVNQFCQGAGGETLQFWEYANHAYRSGGLIQALAPAFGLDDAFLDQFFKDASQIEA